MRALAALLSVSASLHITVWPSGLDGPSQTWQLRCAPAAGTLPRPATACARLARLTNPFAPVRKDVACSEIFGGPQVARIRGAFRGRKVYAAFNRRDGCQTARWDRIQFLFPVSRAAR